MATSILVARRSGLCTWSRRPWGFWQIRGLSTTTNKVSDPLRILFCGADELSCASLQALDGERAQNPALVESIDVVVRPGKRVGRGLKTVREVPLKGVAENLGLPVHVRDTFTGWSPPEYINLIIAVSFGLFVPPRLLRAAKYGGLNVHPSMLPDLRGAAPLHHALLLSREYTGVTLQTLDETSFDHGIVLRQTPPPGVPIPPGSNVSSLLDRLTPMASDILIEGIRSGAHVPPLKDVSWSPPGELALAPKLTPADRQIDWLSWTPQEAVRRHDVLGPLWGIVQRKDETPVRVILADLEVIPTTAINETGHETCSITWLQGAPREGNKGLVANYVETGVVVPTFTSYRPMFGSVLIRPPNHPDLLLRIRKIKVEGKDFRPADGVVRWISAPQSS